MKIAKIFNKSISLANRSKCFKAKTAYLNLFKLSLQAFNEDNRTPRKVNSEIKCFTCGEIGHISKSCPKSTSEQKTKTVFCFNCRSEGHLTANCPEPLKCAYCKQEGHEKKDCPTRPKITCYNCGKEGHVASNCRQPRREKNF